MKNPCRERWNLTQKHFAKYKLNFKNAIQDLVHNGKILSDDTSKAKAFNMFFKSVFTKEPDCLPDFNLNIKSTIDYVSFPADKIKKKLDNLNPYKSPGPGELHPIQKKLPIQLTFNVEFSHRIDRKWKWRRFSLLTFCESIRFGATQ